jgi:hypothetical protein
MHEIGHHLGRRQNSRSVLVREQEAWQMGPAGGVASVPLFLPGFPDARRVKSKSGVGGRGKRVRWKLRDGSILEWDYRHGRVEKYDSRGNHCGEYDYKDGTEVTGPIPGRRVEP